MEQPNYVLQTNEGVLKPDDPSVVNYYLRKAVISIVLIALLLSLLFGENLFREFTWTARILLFVIGIIAFFGYGKEHYEPSPMELQFYNDYMVFYKPKRYYTPRRSRKEYDQLYYKDITKVLYKVGAKRLHIYGNMHSVWYNYRQDGTIGTTPDYDRHVKGGICYFSTVCAENVDFVHEIESHSPLKVIVETN